MRAKKIIRLGMVIYKNHLPQEERDNINGPCCIEVPDWCQKRLGNFYLYFASHSGHHIKMAYSDNLDGPWHVVDNGVLDISRFTDAYDHIASPDIYIDNRNKKIRMYFHARSRVHGREQWTFLALSNNGIYFDDIYDLPLTPFYLRVFKKGDYFYGMSKGGNLWRSRTGLSLFEQGHNPFHPNSSEEIWHNDPGSIRHVALDLIGGVLEVYYSRIGDAPERILSSLIDVTDPDWTHWRAGKKVEVISALESYEGCDFPTIPSISGAALEPVNQLRDPYLLNYSGRKYLFYTVCGEQGIAFCEVGN